MDDPQAPASRRARKHRVNEGVNRLLQTPGWNPYVQAREDSSPAGAAREALRQARIGEAVQAAESCAECEKARAASGDPTDLCPRHLAEAMGTRLP